ncbi:MAG: hypothetical protein HQK53_08255 [Oligoflexia bacterium]|nr:hypothetical protein [Oligoflexia bacterium]
MSDQDDGSGSGTGTGTTTGTGSSTSNRIYLRDSDSNTHAYISSVTADYQLASSGVYVDVLDNGVSTPSKIYIPVVSAHPDPGSSATAQNAHKFNRLPAVPVFNGELTIKLKLRLEVGTASTTNNKSYYLASKENGGDTYHIFGNAVAVSDSERVESGTGVAYTVSFNLKEISDPGYSTLNLEGTETEINKSQRIYIFIADTEPLPPSSFILSSSPSYSEGIHLELRFSSKYDSAAGHAPVITKTTCGDEQLFLDYNNGSIDSVIVGVDNYLETVLFLYSASQLEMDYKAAVAAALDNGPHSPVDKTGTGVKVPNLVNDVTYHLALGIVNKFNFVSKISKSETQTPKSLEVFLKKQGCYLLSAGFQAPSPTLDYFRWIRDHHFLQHEWGRRFVDWYYGFAPKHAHVIYERPWLAALVRGSARSLHWVLSIFIKP